MGIVIKKSDSWIEVPAETPGRFTQGPIQLRPGADETKLRIKILGADEQEVSITDLLQGVDQVVQEHAR